ncbi:hypothetical protein ACWDUX_11805 [Streptomyces sp. NPDC003444]
MPLVAIQPSYGNATARRHWDDTIEQEVDFERSPRRDVLTDAQYKELKRLHPSGRALFWGATSAQDKNMSRLSTGDVVLFTGQKLVRGIGEVGVTFRNADYADTMWSRDPAKGSWLNVYSLIDFRPMDIPYEEIWDLPSFNAGDNFMGLRVLEGEKADEILHGLGIGTVTEAHRKAERDAEVARAIASGTKIVPVEQVHTTSTAYLQKERRIEVRRAESLLVAEYRATLREGQVDRLRTSAGRQTDLHVVSDEGTEVIEAKSGNDHSYVRLALGQLLDYAPHSPEPADRLSALFPLRPADHDVALLHRYGIDCLYRVGPHEFERLEAPSEAREYMRAVWTR